MKKLYFIISLFLITLLNLLPAQAQKVGLVLSGGGAKGLTHIGIIRALEENNIPIDYITGTSMGAIIGSLYAMGYSPDDMEKLIKSEDFKRWYTGNIEERYIYYFKRNPPTPEFLNIRVSLRNPLHKVKTQFLPSSVVNPVQMNIAFVELSKKDIVRHKLVSKIVEAYDHYDKKQHSSKKKGHKKEESPTPIFSDLQGLGDN